MLTCQQYCELASASVDGELDQSEATELRDHLSQCKQCQQQMLELAGLRSVCVQASGSVRAPATLKRSINEMLAVNTRSRERRGFGLLSLRGFSFAPAMAAAAVLLVFFARPAQVPLTGLQKNAFRLAGATSFTNEEAALRHLSGELDMDFSSVRVGNQMKFVAAGPAPLRGCKGSFVAWDDKAGRRLTVLQIDPCYLDCPKGEQFVGLGCQAQQVKSRDGSRVIFWHCGDKLVAVCTDLPEEQAKAISKSVAEQLRTD